MYVGRLWRLFVAPLILYAAACAPSAAPSARPTDAAPQAETKPGRILSVVVRTEPFDLTDNASGRNRITLALFTASLANLQQNAPDPVLAQTLPVLGTDTWKVAPDGSMETSYQLKPGLRWHDGSPLTANDFVFANKANQLRFDWGLSTSSVDLTEHKSITDVSAPDERTLLIRWRSSYPLAATPSLIPLPAHILAPVVEQGSEALGSNPYWTRQYVGAGPYRLREWEPGAYLAGAAFEDYTLGRPKIESVKVTWSADENATLGRLLAADADLAVDNAVGYPQGSELRRQWGSDNRGTVLLSPTWMRHIQVQFRPHVANPNMVLDLRVRKAIAHALDRRALVDALVDGLGIPTDNIGLPTSSYYAQVQQSAARYAYDTRLAEQYLAEAGLSLGRDGVLQTAGGARFSPSVLGIAEGQEGQETTIVVDMLRQVGVDAQLNLVSGALLQRDDEMKSTFPALRTNYITSEDGIVSRLIAAEVSGPENRWGAKNKAGYTSVEHDRLYDQWRRALDTNERNQLMVQLIKFYTEELPVIPTYIDVGVIPHTSALHGPMPVTPDTTPYGNVHLWTWKS
jgi:peptide/nickel transport system substrate-binding protein